MRHAAAAPGPTSHLHHRSLLWPETRTLPSHCMNFGTGTTVVVVVAVVVMVVDLGSVGGGRREARAERGGGLHLCLARPKHTYGF